ncbi:hypothetical protein JG687_00014767 [Phytophthora cactorum]|uniref:Uncharacterized protein n=1 Tax=Phytophthora cactorum TaxID=29920 RepID=A0A8T1TV68_9STRA|nr:hypothetical protein JG687_00014767 [Phytophthora cactorum]
MVQARQTQHRSYPRSLSRGGGGGSSFMPSDFKEICRILWGAGQLPHRQENRQRFTDVEDPTNTAAFKFQISSRLSAGRAVSARVVTRRYQQEDRMVLVWQSIIEGEGMFTGMRAEYAYPTHQCSLRRYNT